jgi:hypothetical protein
MEIEYKIELYYRSDRLEDVLLKLPKLAHPSEEAMRDLRGNNIPDICRFRLCLRHNLNPLVGWALPTHQFSVPKNN